jgi:hypothetical protein
VPQGTATLALFVGVCMHTLGGSLGASFLTAPAKSPPFHLNKCDQHSGGNRAGLRRIVCTLYPYEKYVKYICAGFFSSYSKPMRLLMRILALHAKAAGGDHPAFTLEEVAYI